MRSIEVTLRSGGLGCLLLISCASSLHTAERRFVRSGLSTVELKSIDVIVVASGPPRAAGVNMDVRSFDPPALDEPLLVRVEDSETERALRDAVQERLLALGYAAEVLHPARELRVRRSERIVTSTSAIQAPPTGAITSSAAGASLSPPGDGQRSHVSVDTTTTLRALLERSEKDAVLVVRVVPIDSFYIDIGTGTHSELTPLGRERVEDVHPVQRAGRLLAGQAFVFDRRTGLRLWTKELPDYPDGGRLVPNHPFLKYGVVYEPDKGAPPPPSARAKPAAEAFVRTMFDDFPRAHEGTSKGREELASIDPEREHGREVFLDRGHLALELGGGWGLEHMSLDAKLGSDPVPSLGTGAVAPAGFVRFEPRASYLAPGGLLFGVAVPIGYAHSGFARSYERDNAAPNAMDPNDRAARVTVSHTTSIGLEVTIGSIRFLSDKVLWVPSLGLFGDVLRSDASPSTVLQDTTHSRAGGLGRVDLWFRMSENSPVYARLGSGLKLGFDVESGVAFGVELSGGLGLFL